MTTTKQQSDRLILRIGISILIAVLLHACEPLNSPGSQNTPQKKQDNAYFHPDQNIHAEFGPLHTFYVPVYSSVFVSGGGEFNVAITLSIRNTDFVQPLKISKVSYFNTAGQLIEEYLDTTYILEPMASTHFFVTQTDTRGGVGANFIVQWQNQKNASHPVIEAVMAGSKGTHGIAFINSGHEINSP